MQSITLQFQTPQDMAAFKKVADVRIVEVNIKELQLTCECALPDIAQAMNYYGAVVVMPPNSMLPPDSQ